MEARIFLELQLLESESDLGEFKLRKIHNSVLSLPIPAGSLPHWLPMLISESTELKNTAGDAFLAAVVFINIPIWVCFRISRWYFLI